MTAQMHFSSACIKHSLRTAIAQSCVKSVYILTDIYIAYTLFVPMYTTGEIIRNPVADKREKLYADMQVTYNKLHFVSCLLVSVEL
jgi:ribosome-associated toxin RatA of RatAB toxin-antitoxin module